MIQIVRMAPKEHWCEGGVQDAEEGMVDFDAIAGLPIELLTETMEPHWNSSARHICEGRIWKISAKSSDLVRRMSGLPEDGTTSWLCEHMLEMD